MKIMLLCGGDINSQIVYSYLKQNYDLAGVVQDIKVERKKIFKRRIKSIGLFKTLSQLFFIKLIIPILKLESKKRIEEILSSIKLKKINPLEIPYKLSSVNSSRTVGFINEVSPDVIVVNGTRIISKKILDLIDCPIINIHVGITPKYRGVHGGYWALSNEDIENCGVTVHLVDSGIDTGGILCQKRIEIQGNDNFITYPILQTIKGLECLDSVLKNNKYEVLKTYKISSKLYYHPTIFTYLKKRITKGIK
jgi:methionyl-tRNA formyltransferase